MVRRWSWPSRAAVAALLAANLLAGAMAPPHVELLDDFACAPPPIVHDESAHTIGALPSPDSAHAQHCFLCHSARSFGSLLERYQQRDHLNDAEHLHASTVAVHARVEWTVVQGRAPPSL